MPKYPMPKLPMWQYWQYSLIINKRKKTYKRNFLAIYCQRKLPIATLPINKNAKANKIGNGNLKSI